ncbi:hypothetical protein EV197_0105 [Aquimarina brevivitae]|uniref:Uncharacterized protein n=1 Tax=Aquimarina brevivitae TaxID=323412 RepID=A0A4Q7PEQ0_9FLAO|nr:hypothetical protein EV197_0105 [Aquimarina brevivitae]
MLSIHFIVNIYNDISTSYLQLLIFELLIYKFYMNYYKKLLFFQFLLNAYKNMIMII